MAKLPHEDHRGVCSAAVGSRDLPVGVLRWRPELHQEAQLVNHAARAISQCLAELKLNPPSRALQSAAALGCPAVHHYQSG